MVNFGDLQSKEHRGLCMKALIQSLGRSQVTLAGMLTGVQGDIRCKVLVALSTAK